MDKYQNELSQAAQRLAEIIKARQPQEGMPLKVISGEVKSVTSDNSKAIVTVNEQELSVFNKSKDKLTAGESVWLGYFKTLADAVILFRNGPSTPSSGGGVGEDLGNGNERFNDYVNNTVDFDEDHTGEYNTLKGSNNTIVGAADNNIVTGDNNRIAAGSNNNVSGKTNIVCAKGADENIVEGERNLVAQGGNIVNGNYNAAGCIPNVSLYELLLRYQNTYQGTEDEMKGTTPSFLNYADDYSCGYNEVSGYLNAASKYSKASGDYNVAFFHSECRGTSNMASQRSVAIGTGNNAMGNSIAFGDKCAAGTRYRNTHYTSPPYDDLARMESAAAGYQSYAFGYNVFLVGLHSMAVGKNIVAANQLDNSIMVGEGLVFLEGNGAAVFGYYNQYIGGFSVSDLMVVGNGTDTDNRKNALVLDSAGDLAIAGSYSTLGADYSEHEEWADGNPDNEDRAGHFVTYVGNKIRYANSDDDYILGVVSATPAVIGDSDIGYWRRRFETDVFGRVVYEKAEVVRHRVNDKGEDEEYTVIENVPKTASDYDPKREYIPRSERPEWSPVGTHGKLIVIDDGTCEVDGYCTAADGGIATAAFGGGYRVIERLDDNHIKIRLR